MSDSVDLRYLKLPPAPPVSAPEQDCKPFEPPVPPVMSISDRRKRPVPIVPKPENMDRWKRPIPVVPRPGPENLPCPRCNSANTKFCYYNNNKLSQPRYFCRACRRYWTKGGILRDIPEGSGIARRYGRRSRRRADPAPMAGDPEVPVDGDNEGLVGVVCEGLAEGPSEGDLNEGLGEPFLNGWSLGYREEGLEVSRSAGFEEMGFGRPV